MCTLIVAVRQFSGYPLVIAANRDEALDRPASGPSVWQAELPFVAPKDDKAGGTWLGLNARGLFVGITNRFMGPRDPARASRGRLVTDTLAHASVDEAHRALSALDPKAYNAFHLLYADTTGDIGVTWSDGEALRQERLGDGVHIVTERHYGAADTARADVIHRRWPALQRDGEPDPEALKQLLAIHDEAEPFASLCIHAPAFDYGTRSSTLLLLRERLDQSRYLANDGSPCAHPWSDRTELLHALTGAA